MLDALLLGNSGLPEKRKSAEIYPFVEAYIARKQQQIDEILRVVERYEKKRMMEEQAYQTMSPLRRVTSGRTPDHHLAVEYIHYVKKPMEQVRKLRAEIEAARATLRENGDQAIKLLPEDLKRELS